MLAQTRNLLEFTNGSSNRNFHLEITLGRSDRYFSQGTSTEFPIKISKWKSHLEGRIANFRKERLLGSSNWTLEFKKFPMGSSTQICEVGLRKPNGNLELEIPSRPSNWTLSVRISNSKSQLEIPLGNSNLKIQLDFSIGISSPTTSPNTGITKGTDEEHVPPNFGVLFF